MPCNLSNSCAKETLASLNYWHPHIYGQQVPLWILPLERNKLVILLQKSPDALYKVLKTRKGRWSLASAQHWWGHIWSTVSNSGLLYQLGRREATGLAPISFQELPPRSARATSTWLQDRLTADHSWAEQQWQQCPCDNIIDRVKKKAIQQQLRKTSNTADIKVRRRREKHDSDAGTAILESCGKNMVTQFVVPKPGDPQWSRYPFCSL